MNDREFREVLEKAVRGDKVAMELILMDSPSFHRQHNVELLGKEANRMGIGDLRENIYVHASPKCERRISMEHVSSHPAICTNVFKNGDATTSKAAFTRKWIEMINRIEKNKQLQYGKIQ